MKKTISFVLAVVMLICAVPFQSFAVLTDVFFPKVVKVEFTDDFPVSNKYVKSVEQGKVYIDSYNYSYKAYLSNGRKIEFNNYDMEGTDLLSGIVTTYAIISVNSEECAKAIAEGKSTVNVDVVVYIYCIDDTFRRYSFVLEKPIVEEFVKEVHLIDPIPETYDKFDPTADFVGKRFEVEYADGKKEIQTLEDKGSNGYFLGNEYIYIRYEEEKYIDESTGETVYYKGLGFKYMDTDVIIERDYIPCPFSSFEITDYKINRNSVLTDLSYKLNYKDGRVIEKTFVFDKPIDSEDYVIIDNIDGYDITVGVNGWSDCYFVESWVGYPVWEIDAYIEGDATDFCGCICHKHDFINTVIDLEIPQGLVGLIYARSGIACKR